MRSSVPAFGAVPMIFLRMALASVLVLLPLALWRVGWRPLWQHRRELAVFGLLFTAVPFVGLGYAALAITAGTMAVLQAAAPMCSAVVAWLWLGERLAGPRVLGLLVGFGGVALLVADRIGVFDQASVAIVTTLLVTVLWGVSANWARVRCAAIDPLTLATGSLGVAAVVLAPFAWLAWPHHQPGLVAWSEVVFLGVASSGLGFLIYFGLLRRIGPVRTTTVTFLNPIVAMTAAAVYLGEPVTLRMVAACAVILAGTALTLGLWPPRRRGRPAAAE